MIISQHAMSDEENDKTITTRMVVWVGLDSGTLSDEDCSSRSELPFRNLHEPYNRYRARHSECALVPACGGDW